MLADGEYWRKSAMTVALSHTFTKCMDNVAEIFKAKVGSKFVTLNMDCDVRILFGTIKETTLDQHHLNLYDQRRAFKKKRKKHLSSTQKGTVPSG